MPPRTAWCRIDPQLARHRSARAASNLRSISLGVVSVGSCQVQHAWLLGPSARSTPRPDPCRPPPLRPHFTPTCWPDDAGRSAGQRTESRAGGASGGASPSVTATMLETVGPGARNAGSPPALVFGPHRQPSTRRTPCDRNAERRQYLERHEVESEPLYRLPPNTRPSAGRTPSRGLDGRSVGGCGHGL